MQQGPIAVMLMDHDEGRRFVRGMADNTLLYKNGRKDALNQVYTNMAGYTELLTNHIAKENNILFRMADNVFSADDQQSLIAEFSDIDAGKGKTTSAEFISRIHALAALYLPTN
jgi:hemerythrin-like domain-containing protein